MDPGKLTGKRVTVRRLTVKAAHESLEEIEDFVRRAGEDLGLEERDAVHLQVAVEEACTNIVKYGQRSRRQVTIEIDLRADGRRITTVLRDDGHPFDPLSVPTPDLEADLGDRPVGGLGIHLIRSLMDEVSYEYEDGHNVLTMTQRRRSRS